MRYDQVVGDRPYLRRRGDRDVEELTAFWAHQSRNALPPRAIKVRRDWTKIGRPDCPDVVRTERIDREQVLGYVRPTPGREATVEIPPLAIAAQDHGGVLKLRADRDRVPIAGRDHPPELIKTLRSGDLTARQSSVVCAAVV